MKGIAIREGLENTIVDNNCTMNHQGILFNRVNGSMVMNNSCSRNGIGIYLYNSTFCHLQKNHINHNSFKGFIIRENSADNTIAYNQIGPWNYQGIYIEKSQNNHLHHNQILQNNDDGLGLIQTRDNIIQENNFIGNTNYAIEGFFCFDNAQMNYWDGHILPYLQGDILIAGYLKIHPVQRTPVEVEIEKI
jgi:parallel beta-helix repeat protein